MTYIVLVVDTDGTKSAWGPFRSEEKANSLVEMFHEEFGDEVDVESLLVQQVGS